MHQEEQKRVGCEMAVRTEKNIATALHEAHERQDEEAMDALVLLAVRGFVFGLRRLIRVEAPFLPTFLLLP